MHDTIITACLHFLAVDNLWTPIPLSLANGTQKAHVDMMVNPLHAEILKIFLTCSEIPHEVAISDIQKSIDEENDDQEEEEEEEEDEEKGQLIKRRGGTDTEHKHLEHHTNPEMDYETVVIDYEYYYYDDEGSSEQDDTDDFDDDEDGDDSVGDDEEYEYEDEEGEEEKDHDDVEDDHDESGDEKQAEELESSDETDDEKGEDVADKVSSKTKSPRRRKKSRHRHNHRHGGGGGGGALLEMMLNQGIDLKELFNPRSMVRKRKIAQEDGEPEASPVDPRSRVVRRRGQRRRRPSSSHTIRNKRLVSPDDYYAEPRMFRTDRAAPDLLTVPLLSANQFTFPTSKPFQTTTIVHNPVPRRLIFPLPSTSVVTRAPLPVPSAPTTNTFLFPISDVRPSNVRTRNSPTAPITTFTNVPVFPQAPSSVPLRNSNSVVAVENGRQIVESNVLNSNNLRDSNSNSQTRFVVSPTTSKVPLSSRPAFRPQQRPRANNLNPPTSIIGKLIFHSQHGNNSPAPPPPSINQPIKHTASASQQPSSFVRSQSPTVPLSVIRGGGGNGPTASQSHTAGFFNVAVPPSSPRRPRQFHPPSNSGSRRPPRQRQQIPRQPKAIRGSSVSPSPNRVPRPPPHRRPSTGEARFPIPPRFAINSITYIESTSTRDM